MTSSETLKSKQAADARAYAALGLGIMAIAFNGIYVRLANTAGTVAGFWRLIIAAGVLTIPVGLNLIRGKAKLSIPAVGLSVLVSLALAIDFGTWNTAVLIIGAGMATLLGNTAPIWVALGAWLFMREKLRPMYWAGLGVAVVGVSLIAGKDALSGLAINPGVLLALITGVAYGTYQLLTSLTRKHIDTLTFMWLTGLMGGGMLLVVSLMLGKQVVGLSAETYLWLAAMALTSHLGGWFLVNYAFGHLPVSLVTVTLLAQPVITTILEIVIFKTSPDPMSLLGGVITLVGIYLVHQSNMQQKATQEAEEATV
jgi:drug/metabolite transporter (DMT)-like permease